MTGAAPATPRRLLVTGGGGQVGLELARCRWPEGTALDMPAREALDIGDAASVERCFAHTCYDAVINCAAWTAVDRAEDEIAAAWQANAQGPANLAAACARAAIPIVHLSTDYVFAGDADRPYREDDTPAPRSVYGASKLAGEWAVRTGNPRHLIVRTAWVVSPHRANFVKTMLRLASERASVSVVADQRGCPTSAADIARALCVMTSRLLADPHAPHGVYHFVNAGEASWAELAAFVFARAAERGQARAAVTPITTAQYPTRAARPANSRLETVRIAADFGIHPRHWHEAVGEVVDQLLEHRPKEAKTA